MKFELINPAVSAAGLPTMDTILLNRGIPRESLNRYLNLTSDEILSFEDFGIDNLKAAATLIANTVKNDGTAVMIVDPDCDGYTSSALLANYLNRLFPTWVQNNITFYHHTGKQHGLKDCIDWIVENNFDLVICADSASNDYDEHKRIKGKCIILDHHEADKVSSAAVVINNQLSDYKNKALSGAGVVWQFCRYLDNLFNVSYADDFYDLAATGIHGDMMNMTQFETAYIIREGINKDKIKNPFLKGMSTKNAYSLGETYTPMGWAFYVIPLINSMVRSGTQEEKEILFNSMLEWKAYEQVDSTKRGCKGEKENLVDQAVRVAGNVKNRQTKAQDAGMELIEKLIEIDNMLQHKVLLFKLDPGQIDTGIAGLVANKIMSKYQRPVCVLTRRESEGVPWDDDEPIHIEYAGSARGCDLCGARNFKDVCSAFEKTIYAQGHQSAFGLALPENSIKDFLAYTDEVYKDVSDEKVYQVDYIYNDNVIDSYDIMNIGSYESLWGTAMSEPYIALQNFTITADMIKVYEKRTTTINIKIGDVSIVKFNAKGQTLEDFSVESNSSIKINMIGQCKRNEFNGNITPQIELIDYEILSKDTKKTFTVFDF